MNAIRIAVNVALTLLFVWGGVYLFGQESFFLRDRWHPETGTYFYGASLYLLGASLFCLAAFAAAVALAWIKGTMPMPGRREIRPHPAYKGQIIVRYWYLVIPAFALLLGSFVLAKHVPNPSLQATQQSDVADPSH